MSDALYDQGDGVSMEAENSTCSNCIFGRGEAAGDMAPGRRVCSNVNCPAIDRWVPPDFYCSMWKSRP